jgi:hypothetical protein
MLFTQLAVGLLTKYFAGNLVQLLNLQEAALTAESDEPGDN